MTTSRTASIGTSTTTHTAQLRGGDWGIDCGAVRYRNASKRGALRLHPAGTEATCTRCLAKAPTETPEPETTEAEPLTFMQRQRLAGKAR